MKDLNVWFSSELDRSARAFAWAVEQVPAEHLNSQPPQGLGDWTVARHIFHMLYYERTYALTGMRQWLGDPLPEDDELGEEKAWTGEERVEDLLAQFLAVRNQQIVLLPYLKSVDWHSACETLWGPVTLRWVVTKTYQHTAEHTNDVLRIALFWDIYAEMR